MPTRSQIVLRPRQVVRALSAFALFLVLASVGTQLAAYLTGHDHMLGVLPLFDLDGEQNIPSFFSGCLFLGGAALFLLVWRVRSQNIWLVLAGVFVFLAFDELLQVHETLIGPIRERYHLSGFLYLAWVVVYGAAALVLAVAFVRPWWRLPRRVRFWLGVSAATYLAGAIGFEMLGAPHWEVLLRSGAGVDLLSSIYSTIEESLEMAGLIMLIYSLLLLLQTERGGVAVVVPGIMGSATDRMSGAGPGVRGGAESVVTPIIRKVG